MIHRMNNKQTRKEIPGKRARAGTRGLGWRNRPFERSPGEFHFLLTAALGFSEHLISTRSQFAW